MVSFNNDWDDILKDEFEKPYYKKLRTFLKSEYTTRTIYPPMDEIFSSLKASSFEKTKVVIIGQDPYHEEGQAHGMCFSVRRGVEPPPSLKNIFKELECDVGFHYTGHGELTQWANQGVLLLNAVLTVRQGQANSHKAMGWETFTDRVISELNKKPRPIVFLLWGSKARAKATLINNPIHHKLETVHPSPLSAYGGFFGCKHFSKCNQLLRQSGQEPIEWQI